MNTKTLWKNIRHALLLHCIVPVFGLGFFYIVGKTSRLNIVGYKDYEDFKQKYPHCIFVGWHEQILTGGWVLRRRGTTILISQSHDGEYISRLTRLLGYYAARGSSSRGGVRGFLQLLQALQAGGDVIIPADGPRGPAMQCKAGVITLAKHSGIPIIPIAVLAKRFTRVKSWDRTIVPYPFTTFTMTCGEPIYVPEDVTKDETIAYQHRIEEALNTLRAAGKNDATEPVSGWLTAQKSTPPNKKN